VVRQNFIVPENLFRSAGIILLCVASAALLGPVGAALRGHTDAEAAVDRRAFGAPVSFQISANAFSPGESIPQKFTCDGTNVSPQLNWTDPPTTAQSFALIMDDPDAPVGTWVHWVLYNLPPDTRELTENTANREQLPDGAHQGRNDFNKTGYGGPCPPAGKPHRYFFKLYALDTRLNLRLGATKADVERAMKDHIVAQSELMGRYSR
jgi:Raf kinase inhibitor-like YbhB/YbcL family protein